MNVDIAFCLTDSLDQHALSAALALLSADERARHGRFVRADDRRDFAAAHALLRTTLSACASLRPHQWRFRVGRYGKPSIEAVDETAQLAFNLAHTSGFVTCIVTRDAEVGIDVESSYRVQDEMDIARHYFSRSEIEELARCTTPRIRRARFTEIWTLKEAYIKALGEGLSHPLDSFAFTFEEPQRIRFRTTEAKDCAEWRFSLFAPSPSYRMAVALHSSDPDEVLRVTRFGVAHDSSTALLTAMRPLACSDRRLAAS